MEYCHKCGKKTKDHENYCGGCGASLRKETHRESHSSKKSLSIGKIVLIIFLVLVVYFVLDLFAMSQVELETSSDSLINSLINSNIRTSLTSGNIDTQLTFQNPTFVPVVMTRVSSEVKYGDNIMGEGYTGVVFIAPYSKTEVPYHFELNYVKTGQALVEGFINLFQTDKKNLEMNVYGELGPIKIQKS